MDATKQNVTICMAIEFTYHRLGNVQMSGLTSKMINNGKINDIQYISGLINTLVKELSQISPDILSERIGTGSREWLIEIFTAYMRREDIFRYMANLALHLGAFNNL